MGRRPRASNETLIELFLDMIAAENARLERLVGDVLDLAKLEAHRFTVMQEEVDMARLCEQAYSLFGEEARRRAIEYDKTFAAAMEIVTRAQPAAAIPAPSSAASVHLGFRADQRFLRFNNGDAANFVDSKNFVRVEQGATTRAQIAMPPSGTRNASALPRWR